MENIAFELDVVNRADISSTKVWLFPVERQVMGGENLKFQFTNPTSSKDIDFSPVTGLEVSSEPGQWLVWAGCLLIGAGLFVAFYMVHMRIWAVAIPDARGKLILWVGGAANKNKDRFEQKFAALIDEISSEIENDNHMPATRIPSPEKQESGLTLAGAK
jgi:cytochrome c biogenesis protein